jgi:hypothetical protein
MGNNYSKIDEHINDNVQNKFEELVSDMYSRVISNWDTIQQDQHIMNILNMNTNSMCIKIKDQHPTINDSYIQAYVFTIMATMIVVTSVPITNVLNESYFLNQNETINNETKNNEKNDNT